MFMNFLISRMVFNFSPTQPSFHVGGVYCGSKFILPFRLVNKARTRAKVLFDLSRFRDFSLKFDADVMEGK